MGTRARILSAGEDLNNRLKILKIVKPNLTMEPVE